MSLLSGDRFANKGSGDGSVVPRPILITRLLLWIQGVIGILLSGFILWLVYQQQRLSNTQLAEQIKAQLGDKQYEKQYGDDPPTQDMFNYTQSYLMAGLLIVLMVVLIFCATRLTQRQKPVKFTVLTAQALLVPISVLGMGQIGCVLAMPAIAVIVMLLVRPVKEWYDAPAD